MTEISWASSAQGGGPLLEDAAVEVFVHQRPRYRPVTRAREYPWFYDDQREIQWWGGPGQQILHVTQRSDPSGKVTIAFDTPIDAHGELEFTIEARVVDASRRENDHLDAGLERGWPTRFPFHQSLESTRSLLP